MTIGIETGSFLRAVLENDLVKTFLYRSDESRLGLSSIAVFLDTEAPDEAWGSAAKVQAWIDKHAKERAGAKPSSGDIAEASEEEQKS